MLRKKQLNLNKLVKWLNKLQKIFHKKKAESKDIENIFRIFLKDEKKRKASLQKFLNFFKIYKEKASTLNILNFLKLNSFSKIYNGKARTLKVFLIYSKCIFGIPAPFLSKVLRCQLSQFTYYLLISSIKTENTAFLYKTALSEANARTNRMGNKKWTFYEERRFTSNYFLRLKILFQFKNLL